MLASLLVLLASAPTPAPATGRTLRVAIPNLSLSDVPAARGVALVDYLAEQLSSGGGLRVTTPSEIAAVLGQERQKQLLGCTDDTACLIELSNALGADVLVVGSVAKVGAQTLATIKAVRSSSAEPVGAWSVRAADETQLLDFFASTARQLRAALLGEAPSAASNPRSPLRYMLIVAGAVAVVTGAVLFGYGWSVQQRLVKGDPAVTSVALAEAVASGGRSAELAGYVAGGVGLALLVGGIAYALVSSSEPPVTVGAAWVTGPTFTLSARLP